MKIRKKYGRDLALCGGVDKRELAKDKKSIEKEMEIKMKALQGEYGA